MGIFVRGACVFVLALLLGCVSAIAAQPKAKSPAALFAAQAHYEVLMHGLRLDAGEFAEAGEGEVQAVAAMESGLAGAVASLKGKGDATSALKAYYLTAKDYFRNALGGASDARILVNARRAQLRQAEGRAYDALMLELKLAGVIE